MPVVVRNKSADLPNGEVNQTLTHDGVGDVTMTLEGRVYHWSPGQSITLSENLAAAALAESNLLEEKSRS